jgi:hypothetical protein
MNMADGFYKPILCSVCGKPMKYTKETGYMPLAAVITLTERGYPDTALMNYICSEQHKRAWYIPSAGDRAEVLIQRDFPIG